MYFGGKNKSFFPVLVLYSCSLALVTVSKRSLETEMKFFKCKSIDSYFSKSKKLKPIHFNILKITSAWFLEYMLPANVFFSQMQLNVDARH